MSDKIDTTPAAIAAILEGVTRGPWRKDGVSVGRLPADESYVAVCVSSGTRSRLEAESNAAFIAAARDLVPALATERGRLVIENARLQDALGKVIAIARAALERESHAPDPRVTAQLAEARAEGWRQGVEAASLAVAQTEIGFHDGISGDWHPMSGLSIISAACTAIRALPLPADLGVRHE